LGTAWAKIRQEEDERLVAAADTLYEVESEVTAQPRSSNRPRSDRALKSFGDEARRTAPEARMPRWRVRPGNRLLGKSRR
jgi:hypothetical protein